MNPGGGVANGPRGYLRVRRLALRLLVQVLVIVLLLEGALRVGVRVSPPLHRLLYAAWDVPADAYTSARTLEELLGEAPTPVPPFSVMHEYVFNSRGLRTGEYAVQRVPGTRRVVLIGDSFLLAGGYSPEEKQVAAATARFLGRRARTEVINLSTPGVGALFYSRMLDVEGVRLKPDAVVVAFFVGNDITDEWAEYSNQGRPAALEAQAALARTSFVYRCVRNTWRLLAWPPRLGTELPRDAEAARKGRGGYPTGEVQPPRAATFTVEAYAALVAERSLIYDTPVHPGLLRRMEAVAERLARMREAAEKAGIRFLVVLIPDETQVDKMLQAGLDKARPNRKHDYGQPQRLMTGMLGKRGTECLDLLPEFGAATRRGRRLYLVRDSHWNGDGQELAASAIARRVEGLLAAPR